MPASGCDGNGGCALATGAECTSHACVAAACVAPCTSGADCPAGDFCSAGACEPKGAGGATCVATQTNQSGDACASGACLSAVCCAVTCATSDTTCGATRCDQKDGACVYPGARIACGALPQCSAGESTSAGGCSGDGTCVPGVSVSCEPYLCRPGGIGCAASCSLNSGECAADAFCNAGACVRKEPAGTPCAFTSTSDANSACISGICSINCCVASCPADPTTNDCQGNCDPTGACTPVTCKNLFGCSGTSICNTKCRLSADCSAAGFCDPVGASACCPRFNTGDTIAIDSVGGSDATPCCGAQSAPCQTLAHAMKLVAASATTGVILNAANSDGTSGWAPTEAYPIHLGWGVTLNAGGIHFASAKVASEIFQVYSYAAADTGTVTIQGGSSDITTDAVFIGFDPGLNVAPAYNYIGAFYNSKVGINAAVAGKTGVPLVLSEVWLNTNDQSGASYDLEVGPGTSVTLGPDPVEMGNGNLIGTTDPATGNLAGSHSIHCKGAGASIQDDSSAKSPVLSVEIRNTGFLEVEDGCTVSLTQGPRLGNFVSTPANWDGTLGGCSGYQCYRYCISNYIPPAAVKVTGSGSVTFGSAAMPGAILCATTGFDQETSNASGSPTISVNGAMVDLQQSLYCYGYYGYCYTSSQSVCAGAMVTEGAFSAAASTFTHGYLGVFVGSNAVSADLSGGGNGGNTFLCNSSSWGGSSACGNNFKIVPNGFGADVVNESGTVGISAQNATWDNWDSTDNATQVWSCSDDTYSDCTCTGPNCSNYTSPGTPPDDADAITLSTNTAGVPLDTSAGTQSTNTSCQ